MEIAESNYEKNSEQIILSKELIYSAETNVSNESEETSKCLATRKIKNKTKAPKKIGFVNRKGRTAKENSESNTLQNTESNETLYKKAESLSAQKIQRKNKKTNLKNAAHIKENSANLICFDLEGAGNSSKNKALKPKSKLMLQLFQAFKKQENYKKFKNFAKIENSIYMNKYDKVSKMAADTRNTFNNYFRSFAADATTFPKLFALSNHFENIVREFENKKFLSETKNYLEIKKKMNKLQKIVKISKNNASPISSNPYPRLNSGLIRLNNCERKISHEFKLELLNNIKSLSPQQVRGIVGIVMENRQAPGASSFELDINKLPAAKVKELDKYVRKCLLELKQRNFPNEIFSAEKGLESESSYEAKRGNGAEEINMNNNNNYRNAFNWANSHQQENGFYYNNNQTNFLLRRKQKASFFEMRNNESNNDNKNCESNKLYSADFQNANLNSEKTKCESNFNNKSLSNKGFLIQTSCTNPETPVSYFNKLNKMNERKNSLMLESDSESDESSDEESYSDLKVGNFKI